MACMIGKRLKTHNTNAIKTSRCCKKKQPSCAILLQISKHLQHVTLKMHKSRYRISVNEAILAMLKRCYKLFTTETR